MGALHGGQLLLRAGREVPTGALWIRVAPASLSSWCYMCQILLN